VPKINLTNPTTPTPSPTNLVSEIATTVSHLLNGAVVLADMREKDIPLIWLSKQFTVITGYSEAEALGKNCRYLQGSDRLQPEINEIRNAIRDGESVTVIMRNYRKNGELFWNELSLAPHLSDDGIIIYYVGIIRDVTISKLNNDKMVLNATSDRLTGLLNRDSVFKAIEAITLPDGYRLMVIKLDIVGLHSINISSGYDAGDEVIRKIATRLQSLEPDTLGRVGNNEFAFAFSLSPALNEETILLKIAGVMRPPLAMPDAIINVRYALGYTVGEPGQPTTSLTQQAGYALHASKSDTARAPRRYNHADARLTALRNRTASELQQAIRDGDFVYHYQPQFDIKSRRIVGVEALLRWNHPVFGLQFPDKFIAIAEETGLISSIERAGIREVATLAAKINKSRSNPIVFSINISPVEITSGTLERMIQDVIGISNFEPQFLTLEITESLVTDSTDDIINLFARLRAIGVGLSIDDFGTGYSSLRSIERFPISEIKIDGSFTRNVLNGGIKRIVIETILALGRELGVRVVAEGIETEEHLNAFSEIGCRVGQGYLFSRPVPAEQLAVLLAAES
jgi:PAS domain S-box-containing protein/diguanylate cyclase (GGDEF)-like protein